MARILHNEYLIYNEYCYEEDTDYYTATEAITEGDFVFLHSGMTVSKTQTSLSDGCGKATSSGASGVSIEVRIYKYES